MPQQNVFPAPVGPAPLDGYEYLVVPFQLSSVVPSLKTIYFFIESQMGFNGAFADRLDLVNGDRIYRVELQYLWRFPADKVSHFVGILSSSSSSLNGVGCAQGSSSTPTMFRFQVTNPGFGLTPVRDWTPCSL